jgi:hypothetical protein
MMSFWKKRKISRLKDQIVKDPELLLEQKEVALSRLAEKERELAPFSLETVTEQSQDIFQTLLPTLVGQVQVKRLKNRNDMIREMRTTLTELAETKKAWVRLKNIDAEIAVDQALAYQTVVEKKAAHAKNMAELKQKEQMARLESERDLRRHELLMLELDAKAKQLNEELTSDPPKKKTPEEELFEKFKLDLLELEHEFKLEKLIAVKEQAGKVKTDDSDEKYNRMWRYLQDLEEEGADTKTLQMVRKMVNREFDFMRDD